MGDISTEPSMEEILSSIKRIIAEEGDPPGRSRRAARPGPTSQTDTADSPPEVLELNTPVPVPPTAMRAPEPVRPALPAAEPAAASPSPAPAVAAPAQAATDTAPLPDSMLSREAVQATRGSLDVLSRLVTKPEPGSDGTLEGLVRDMLRPMMREWLDANLPQLVEAMVAREIAKITGQAG